MVHCFHGNKVAIENANGNIYEKVHLILNIVT